MLRCVYLPVSILFNKVSLKSCEIRYLKGTIDLEMWYPKTILYYLRGFSKLTLLGVERINDVLAANVTSWDHFYIMV